jgi:hypothetical protein
MMSMDEFLKASERMEKTAPIESIKRKRYEMPMTSLSL